ncbi:ZIP family metal transporter [Natranaerobius thermophilus]|nr:ZIP family metal transporter [Natranaerobius thermophilus]
MIFSTLAGMSTLMGAGIVFLFGTPSRIILAVILGFSGGVMFSVSIFELITEALKLSYQGPVLAAFFAGGFIMWCFSVVINKFLTPTHQMYETEDFLKTGYLVILGIALHNLPEGLAIGTGIEASPDLSLIIAITLAIHNIPEGMATAGPLKAGGLNTFSIIILITFAGLVTPLGTMAGIIFMGVLPDLVGISLGIAGGAMIYLVIDELLPKAQSSNKVLANSGFFLGFILGKLIVG